jgi:hypothetical protein
MGPVMDIAGQILIRCIIDEAVASWHKVADDHDIVHCNCFREAFAQRLIDLNIFVGYKTLADMERRANGSCDPAGRA